MTDAPAEKWAASAPTEMQVLNVGKTLKINSFKIHKNYLEIRREWKECIKGFEEEPAIFEITDVEDKV